MEKREEKISIYLVQQGVWNVPLESMPLASGYLKAAAMADDRIREHADIGIHNFQGGTPLIAMANTVFRRGAPHILACSVLGWNFRTFGALAETFKQIRSDGWVVFGGTHVANQAQRTFRMFPEVDVIVNGEGELVFRDIINAYLDGVSRHALSSIPGISFRDAAGEIKTTVPRERISDLDIIPSPFLTGAIELADEHGNFRYDVALMETNRGCPYKCSFCYWGGAVGQRVRAFSRARLKAELELFAQHKVHTIVLSDANFGMLHADTEFVDDLLDVRQRYGYPRALETSWAKNKSNLFYEIVRKMKQNNLRSSFTLALQTLNSDALEIMNRRNMKVNDWEELAEWLDKQGLDCYAELIWGAPGETVDSFMEGYDRLSRHVSRIAVYPLHLLPNTDYAEKKAEYGIVSVRGDDDDFEYVLAHDTLTFAENNLIRRFLFWSRVMGENAVLRHTWVGLRELCGKNQSEILRNFDDWVDNTEDPAAAPLRAAAARAVGADVAFGDAVSYLYGDPDARRMLERWWAESVRLILEPESRPVLDEIFRYDLLTQPYYRTSRQGQVENLATALIRGEKYFIRKGICLQYRVPQIIAALRAGEEPDLRPQPTEVDLYYRVGAENFIGSTNHEEIVHFMGITRNEVYASATTAKAGVEARKDISALLSEHRSCT